MAKETARQLPAEFPLFRPGFGNPPPLLAGRETEKEGIEWRLAAVASGHPPGVQICLIGPRGNGKTALLGWAQDTTRKGGTHSGVGCVRLTGGDFRSYERLVLALASKGGKRWLQHSSSGLLKSAIGIASQLFAGFSLAAGEESRPQELLGPLLERRAKKKLLVLVDEAHVMGLYPEAASDFFNAVQIVAARLPLLLVLAGTPDLPSRLNSIQATFWGRIEKIGVGLLTSEAAREAIRQPLNRAGYGIEDGALMRGAEAAQRYPYFLQLVGDALHIAAFKEPRLLEPGHVIGNVLLDRALAVFGAKRDSYYADRYRELEARKLVPAAEAVAELFISHHAVPSHAFKAAVAGAVDPPLAAMAEREGANDAAFWAEEQLRNVGFVWSGTGSERMCESGIPSLMDYVAEAAAQRLQESGSEAARPGNSG